MARSYSPRCRDASQAPRASPNWLIGTLRLGTSRVNPKSVETDWFKASAIPNKWLVDLNALDHYTVYLLIVVLQSGGKANASDHSCSVCRLGSPHPECVVWFRD